MIAVAEAVEKIEKRIDASKGRLTSFDDLRAFAKRCDEAIVDCVDAYRVLEETKDSVANIKPEQAELQARLFARIRGLYAGYVEYARRTIESAQQLRGLLNQNQIENLELCHKKAKGFLAADAFTQAQDNVILSAEDVRVVDALLKQ